MTVITNKSGAELKFGMGGLKNPTPKVLKYIFRGLLFLSLCWTFLAPGITELPPSVTDHINTWILRGVGLMNLAIQFFGWDFDVNKPDTDYPTKP